MSLRQLDDDCLTCRLLGHAWNPIQPDREAPFGKLLTFECFRCGSKRDDIFAPRTGEVLQRTYRYTDRYKLPKGRVSRAEVRKVWSRRRTS